MLPTDRVFEEHRPGLERLANATSVQEARSIQAEIETELRAFAEGTRNGVEVAQRALEAQVQQAQRPSQRLAELVVGLGAVGHEHAGGGATRRSDAT